MERKTDRRETVGGTRERGMDSARYGSFPVGGTKDSDEIGIESEVERGRLESVGNCMDGLASAEMEVKILKCSKDRKWKEGEEEGKGLKGRRREHGALDRKGGDDG